MVLLRTLSAGFLMLTAILGGPSMAGAMGVSPSAIDVSFNEFNAATAVIEVMNESEVEKRYLVDLKEASFGAHPSDLSFIDARDDVRASISVTPLAFVLGPHQAQSIAFDLAKSRLWPSEDVNLAVLIEESGPDRSDVTVRSAGAVMVFVRSSEVPEVPPALTLSVSPSILTGSETTLSLTIKNDSSRTMVPIGQIVVVGPLGNEVGAFPINQERHRLPSDTSFDGTWAWPEKGIRAWLWPGLGEYTAEATLLDGSRATATFIVIPWRVGLILVIIFGAIVGILRASRSTPRRHA